MFPYEIAETDSGLTGSAMSGGVNQVARVAGDRSPDPKSQSPIPNPQSSNLNPQTTKHQFQSLNPKPSNSKFGNPHLWVVENTSELTISRAHDQGCRGGVFDRQKKVQKSGYLAAREVQNNPGQYKIGRYWGCEVDQSTLTFLISWEHRVAGEVSGLAGMEKQLTSTLQAKQALPKPYHISHCQTTSGTDWSFRWT